MNFSKLSWYKDGKKHGKSIGINMQTIDIERVIYVDGKINGTFNGYDMTSSFE